MSSIALFCSSQDIATDALAVGLLQREERGWGNSIQAVGGYLGAVIGSGMLILLNIWGWRTALLAMASMMLLALIPVLRHKEQQTKLSDRDFINPRQPETKSTSAKSYLQTFTDFYRRPGMWRWLLILLVYPMAPYMGSTMFRPFLVDTGLSLAEIGLLVGGVSYTAGMLGAIVAGFVITFMGRKRSLVLFSLLEAIALALYLLPAFSFTNLSILYLVAISRQFALGMLRTAIYTIMMDKCDIATGGTDYTTQTSIAYLSAIIVAPISGILAKTIGYRGLFVICVAIAMVSTAIIAKSFAYIKEQDRVLQEQ